MHGDKLLVGFEIVVFGKDTCSYQLILQNLHEIEQILRLVVTYIIYFIGRNGKTIFANIFFGSMLHDSNNSFNDVINVGEVSLTVAVVEDLDGFAFDQLVGKAKVCHVGTTCGAINGEET